MAGPAVIGALRVVLGADSAALDKGLKDAQGSLAAFGKSVETSLKAVGAAFAVAGVALGVAVKQSINQADELGKTAQKIGVPVEELSKLKHAADLSGISMETLAGSMGKLSKAMVEAAAKPTSEAANAFKALGVQVTDSNGKLRSSTDVLVDIAGKFEGLKDGAGKTAVAMAVFGRSGKELIPLLNAGAGGLKDMMAEAEQLGIVIDSKTAKSAEAFNDNLTRLGKVKDGIVLQITSRMLPAFEQLSNVMVASAKDAKLMQDAADFMSGSLRTLVSVGLHAITIFQRLPVEFAALRKVTSAPLFTPEFTAAVDNLNKTGEETRASFARLKEVLNDATVAIGTTGGGMGSALEDTTSKQKDFNYAALGGKTALDQFLDSQAKSQAAQQAAIATDGLAAGAKERLKVVLQGLAIAQANHITLTDAQRAALTASANAAEQNALKLQGLALVNQNSAPWEQFRTELANSETAMKAVGATAEQLARNQERVAQQFGLSWSQIGQNIAGTAGALSQLTGVWAKENKAMGVASKAFGISQAIINTQIAITKALATLPPPASYAAVALAVAQGAASIATISAQKFATGGSFTIPGGFGGSDSKMVPIMGFPGERVTVDRPAPPGSTSGSGNGRVLTIPAVRPRDYFRGDVLNDLMQNVQEWVNDGGRINFRTA